MRAAGVRPCIFVVHTRVHLRIKLIRYESQHHLLGSRGSSNVSSCPYAGIVPRARGGRDCLRGRDGARKYAAWWERGHT